MANPTAVDDLYSEIENETRNEHSYCSYIKKMNCLSTHSLTNESNTIATINPMKIKMIKIKRIVYRSQAKDK